MTVPPWHRVVLLPRAALALVLACGADGSAGDRGADTIRLRLGGHAGPPLQAAELRYEPADAVRSARLGAQGWLAIERRSSARALTVRAPGFCPVTVPPGARAEPIELRPFIDLGADRAPVGFAARFTIVAQLGCPEPGDQVSWQQVEGPPLEELSVTHEGSRLSARTQRFEVAHPQPPAVGLVPVSPRTQGRVVLEARWLRSGVPPVRRTIAIHATSRSTGLSSVAVSQQLLLGGPAWRVASAPRGGHAQVHSSGPLSVFTPDAPGRWGLASDAGRVLTLQAFWHDKTPYDCGRSECHGSIAESTTRSPMSHALERQLSGSRLAAVSCMLDCHVLGERGLQDGGFLDVANQLGWTRLDSSRWHDLPQALRRLGGVRCTACHGPGAIPEPDAREQVLRSDVCATCHDAPPRYVHVQQWGASGMASSDASVSTRSGACARCHTTSGFLTSLGARAPSESPREHVPAGIACAACHAPHASHSGARLIRQVPEQSVEAAREPIEPRSAICLPCHTPTRDEPWPSASSGVFWLGRAHIPAAEGDGWSELAGGSAHRSVPGGCVGCHGAGPSSEDSAVEHSFRVDRRVCTTCHGLNDELVLAPRAVQQRAVALAHRIDVACATPRLPTLEPRHASSARPECESPRLRRALHAVGLVLEDPAAGIHNAAFAHRLLDEAEAQLLAPAR